ncbi:MAG: type II secretion system protein [Oscillospiraceae bacterium]
MQKKLSKQNNSGFTLSEVLIAVAILIVLMGLAMIPITRHQRDLRQTELDAKAEIVYHAAQNKLSELLANGRISDCYAEDLQPLNNTPLDAAERKTSLYYVTSAAKTGEGSAAAAILPKDQVDHQLWDNHWVIELDPTSGSVYAVFYSEKTLTYDFDSFNPLRFRDGRLSAGATVGYYGGDSVQSEITGKLTPHMEIINKEQLLLRVTCDTPMEPLHFYVTVSDGVHSTSRIELTGSEVKTDYLTYTATMVLDSLTDGMRFGQQARFKNKNLTPGADLTITVEVTCENRLVDSASGTLTANSLFAEVRGGDTAVVTYARHLQNLDTASRLPDSITRAVQEQDIQFVNENTDDGWDRLYGSRTFTPITNSRLTYCESKATVNGQVYHPVIYGLTVNTTGDGGLFAAFSGTLKNLRLCGADITASGNAGGLAGRLSGKTEILDCQVYLSPTRDKLSAKTEQDIWLRGSTAGGLAGRCDGTLTIRRSFAATVIQGVRYAGGLVGNTDSAALTVDHSYADCYLYAAANNGVAGGLIGACNGTANIALSNCYAAGFQSAGTTAGLSGGELSDGDSLKACYSACVRLGTDMKLTYSTVKPPAAGTAPADIDAVYYLFPSRNDLSGTSFVNYAEWSGQNRAEGVKVLGTAFTAETSDTVAYNLMDDMGLSTYSYPRLTGLPHYGDWQADFESGALAYYEKYSDGTYGFLGANRSTLRSGGTVVDDGYGMVYRTQPTDAITVAYTLGGIENTDTLWHTEDIGGGYWLVRLPDELVYTSEVSPAFYRQVTVDDISYFFNPHFACRVIQSAALPSAPAEVGIRTARHLHDLSLYYDTYRTLLDKTAVFRQERPIDYNSYARLTVHTQPPIGAADGKPFIHTYDGGGYTIAAPSFTGTVNTDGTSYAGMFGLNRGTLRNIILLTANKDRTVSLEGQLSLQTACIGALTGCNEGTVYNCAAAGFSVNGDARHGSILYLGGLVGRNSGTVRASGVSAPRLFANSLYATLCAGGFAGGNSGVVQQCYAMADIEIGTINGGGVTLGGFAGSNTGSLRASYCATAMTSPNADIHGFAPTAGGVSGCCYLNGGTYRFVDSVHLYQYTDRSGAAPVNEPALRGMATRLGGFGAVSSANTFQHDKTLDSAGKAYPYPGIVVGHDGSRVHYGDWVTPADMGVLGLLYWEYESKPTGSGYYFSSIGVEDGEYKANSSLCVSHDDGGTVTAYGYGYYWSAGSTTEPALFTGITVTGTRYTAAADDLHRQMPEFNFVTYKTSDNGLHLTSGTQANDAWTLTHEDAALTYTVSPFFADAFALSSNNAPGTASKPYQVRSIEQLQYINWSYIDSQGSTTRDVTGSNSDYKYYPYLQYTNRRGNALQTKAMALAGDSTGGPRPILTWQQTHDLNGAGHGTAADGTAANYDFHPIAGAVNNGQLNDRGNETYDLTLYNWFGGIYDGGNYYIKNVNITSHCYNVGLFGTTAGAEIKNIVLYSDNDAVIQRKTDATPASGATGPENYATSYALGGLVGIAYDYDENLKDKTKVSTISNCAIAGYTVTDNSKTRQFLGEAAIGGLVGVSSANLNRCSAVVKLNINCTHRYANTGAMNKAQWGNYVRVGGLVGGVRYDVSDCYTGGSITVASDLLNERILTGEPNTSFVDRYEKTPKSVKMTQGGAEAGPDTYVYIGGIGGSGFSATFSNFSGSKDGQPTYNNCYTYMTFPAMEGTITGISLIGSIADRAGVNGGTAQLTINNCYYLDSSAAISFNSLPTFYGKSTQSNGQYTYYSLATLLSTDAARMDMLRGKLSYLSKYTWNTGSSTYNINGLTALTYDQMSAQTSAGGKTFVELLNGNGGSSFHWVTTEENGQAAHGKYSFPGSAAALQGQNYPFPTVLTQETQYGTAHLHYGAWPTSGLYWSNGLLSLDRITTPTAKLTLTFSGDAGDELPVITCARDDVVTVSEPVRTSAPGKNPTTYTVEFTGLSVGSTEVFATLGDYTARLLVSVTSTLDISVDGLPGDDFFVGDTATLTLSASDSKGSTLSGVKWRVIPSAGSNYITASAATDDQKVTLTAVGEGEDLPRVEATYTNAAGESFTSQLPLVLPVRMQGVLGIANTSVPEKPAYRQGIMTRAGDAFLADTDASVPPYNGAPYTDTPAYTGAPLYLYGQGSAADLTAANEDGSYRFTLSAATVTVGDGTDAVTCDALSGTADYRIFEGQPQSLTDTLFTVRPLTVKGRQPGPVTLTVTLTDAENRTFTLSIPYTLTEQDTQVTATLWVDGQALALSVPYGTAPAAEALSQLLADHNIPEAGISWTPDITQPLYADTAFTAVRKTTDSGGAPTVPDADIPASGSKDPEGTPSDDPSAPDSSSSGTGPTPEPSPDTLP